MHKTVLLRTLQNQTALNGTTLHSTSLYICSIVGIEPTEANLRWKDYFAKLNSTLLNKTGYYRTTPCITILNSTLLFITSLHFTSPQFANCSLLGLKPNLSGKSARDKVLFTLLFSTSQHLTTL